MGLNSDESVRTTKGPGRPITSQEDRKALLEALQEVDEVVIFEESAPTELVSTVNPSVLVKGGEWTAAEVRERDSIPAAVDIKIFPLLGQYSTTNLINQISQADTE